MKNRIPIVIAILVIYSCSQPKEYTIDFCTNFTADVECDPSMTTFRPGDRVYILLECDRPFTDKVITGNFYFLDRKNRIPLGSQDWNINPGDSYAYDYVDFTEKGTYEFEFLNNKGEILGSKKLEIK